MEVGHDHVHVLLVDQRVQNGGDVPVPLVHQGCKALVVLFCDRDLVVVWWMSRSMAPRVVVLVERSPIPPIHTQTPTTHLLLFPFQTRLQQRQRADLVKGVLQQQPAHHRTASTRVRSGGGGGCGGAAGVGLVVAGGGGGEGGGVERALLGEDLFW